MLQFLQRPLSLPFVLTIFIFFTWISLHFHTASKASSSSLHWTAIHDINANLLRFRSGISSKILKDERGWLLDPLSLASASDISGGAITCASIHAGEIRPGKLRGNHRHHDCNETLVIWGAITRYRLENSKVPHKRYGEVTIGFDDIIVAASPSGTAHAIKNTGLLHIQAYKQPSWPSPNTNHAHEREIRCRVQLTHSAFERLRMGDSSTSSTSSISQGTFKTTKPSHFRAKINFQNIEIVVRKLHQNTINLSVKNLKKKQTKNTQLSEKMAARNQTKDLKCATHLLNDKFRNMTKEKKAIVRDLGFGGLMHIPPLRVDHQLLRELAKNFKLGENKLRTGYGSFHITPKKIGDALGINATGDLFPEKVDYKKLSDEDKIIYRRFQGKTLKSLTDEMMEIGVGNEEERLMFKRIFILYIQMAFLLPTTINKISPVHLVPIFEMEGIEERNWGGMF
ncbi:uncharacterized protein [Arachis hypogaea]|uniref:uncharacterized protein n=1 Tax=Arachis hypogaea TaxID=3818 RepID=UPI003B211A4F